MSQLELGVGYHIHYVRLDTPTTLRMKQEAARLGLPVSEVFRRAIDVYFETIGSATPLPERQTSEPPSPSLAGAAPVATCNMKDPLHEFDDGRFNLLGDGDDGEQ